MEGFLHTTHTATGAQQLSIMAILYNVSSTDSTYLDVWPGTTCSLLGLAGSRL
jgi:hypothetical protein